MRNLEPDLPYLQTWKDLETEMFENRGPEEKLNGIYAMPLPGAKLDGTYRKWLNLRPGAKLNGTYALEQRIEQGLSQFANGGCLGKVATATSTGQWGCAAGGTQHATSLSSG